MSLLQPDRRHFLAMLASTAAAPSAFALGGKEEFSFIFLTDAHIQPELDASHGTQLAMQKARSVKADFALQGGDHVFDVLGVPKERALQLFDLYGKAEQDLGLKVYHTIGNHDAFGVYPSSGSGPADPAYGKQMFIDHFGPTYYTFDHKGIHFIVLDSIEITPERQFEGRINATQMTWLANDLAAQKPGTPIIVCLHMPLVTALAYYADPMPKLMPQFVANAPAVIKSFEGHNVIAVLQGHTHVNEQVLWRGVPYITSGAVCGNWWHGTRLGTPEGFTVVTVSRGKVTTRYEASGFQTIAPENT